MGTLLQAESRRLYSWWWDSHICPKNSKWLQENLTDMDAKIKTMIKLLEEDADSFAKRAEMYYKKRPELMKMVEEFYRAYRALAERYDHATVELRQAHRTMVEAFPNHIQLLDDEESPTGSSLTETDPHTPEMPHHIRAFFDLPDELQNDAAALSSHIQAVKRDEVNAEDSDAISRKERLKQLREILSFEGADHAMFSEGRVRKGLQFEEEDDADESSEYQENEVADRDGTDDKTGTPHDQDEVYRLLVENEDLKMQSALESERVGEAEAEVESLRQVLSKLQAEEEAARLQYQQCLERISDLEAEISHGQEEVSKLKDEVLMGAMNLNGAEERCLLLDRANQSLKSEVDALVQKTKMKQEVVGKNEELENLRIRMQDEHLHRVQAEKALHSLQHSHSQSEEEKKALILEIQKGVQMLSDVELMKQGLEDELQQIKDENRILNERSLSSAVLINNLQDEISSLKEKAREIEKEAGHPIQLNNSLLEDLHCLKEEKDDLNRRYRDVMEQIESVGLNAMCIQSSVEDLQEENLNLKDVCQENDHQKEALLERLEDLSEKNMLLERSLSDATATLQGLRETLKTIEGSHQLLQDENLKLKEFRRKNDDEKLVLLEKLESMENFSEKKILLEKSKSLSDAEAELEMKKATIKTSVDSYQCLQDEDLKLKESCQQKDHEKLVLVEKLENMEKVLEKNMILENSLSEASAESEVLRAKLNAIEESFNSIQGENLELKVICQKNVEEMLFLSQKLESMEKLSENNILLEISVSETTAKLEWLEAELNTLEESYQSLQNEKTSLHAERVDLLDQVETIRLSMKDLDSRHKELENKHSSLEKDTELTLEYADELRVLMNQERHKHASSIQSVKTECVSLENQLYLLEEEALRTKKGLEEEQDKVINAQIEVFVLQRCIHDIEERNLSLSVEWQKNVDVSTRATTMILELERENFWQQEKAKSLSEKSDKLKMVIHQVLKELDISLGDGCQARIEDQVYLPHILERIKDMRDNVLDVGDENQLLIFERSINNILLEQLRLEANNLKVENYTLKRQFEVRNKEFLMLQAENHRLFEKNKQLILAEEVGIHSEEVLRNKMENLQEESETVVRDAMIQANLSLIFESIVAELCNEIEEGRTQEKHLESKLQMKIIAVELQQRENAELLKDVEELMTQKEHLGSQLLTKINEADLLEIEAVALYEDLQISVICASLLEAKSMELIAACKSLQGSSIIEKQRYDNERDLIRPEVEELKRQVAELEGDNLGLKAEVDAYLPFIASFKESVSSLESLALSPAKVLGTGIEDMQGASVEMDYQIEMSSREPIEYQSVPSAAGVSELQELNNKVQAVEKVMTETMRVAILETSSAKTKLEVAMEENKELKQKSKSAAEEDTEARKDVILPLPESRRRRRYLELQRNDAEASQSKHGFTMKDIQLDHVSDSSSHRNSSYAMDRRQNDEIEDDEMLELWETAERDFNFKSTSTFPASDTANKDVEAAEDQRSEYLSPEWQSEKEPEICNQEVSRIARERLQEGDARIVETLASDAHRLMNLQTSVKELKTKTETSGNSNRSASLEYENMKRQLNEVEEAILESVEINMKLTKTASDDSASASQPESAGELGNAQNQQVVIQVKKSSEKIDRLELELQRIRYILLKLEEQHKSTRTRDADRSSSTVLLKDYLYGGSGRSQRKKKASFCSCFKPATMDY